MMVLHKLKRGDKVAIVSPSFAAPGKWPAVYELGLSRVRDVFGLEPVEFPTTKRVSASAEERTRDLIAAFEDSDIKAVIASIGGDDQVTFIKYLPAEPFVRNPKPFFGFSDNSHVMNFLWLCGVPSYYGGALFTQFAMQKRMDDFSVRYLKHALFDEGEFELVASDLYNDIGLDWSDPKTLDQARVYEPNEGFVWDGEQDGEGLTWGGCVESVDEMLRHGVQIPSLEEFERVVLIMETSEEIPSSGYVFRVFRALGERGILERVQGVLVGRAKAWGFHRQQNATEKKTYRAAQQAAIVRVVRAYNPTIPVIQNMDFGHTDPQMPLPYGKRVRIDAKRRHVVADF